MKLTWNRFLSGATALLCAGAAQAYVIDFESADMSGAPFAPLLSDGDYVAQGAYFVQAFDANNTGSFNGSLVGQMMKGSDPTTCLDGACPSGNSTNYISALNNGILYLGGATNMVLTNFDAAFLPPSGVALPTGTVALLGVEADRADGSYALGLFNLAGPSASTGATSFTTYRASDARIAGGTGTLTSGNVVDFYFYAYYCGASTSCSAFSADKGQFALDNVALVPEPSEWMLIALGLGAVGACARRRRSV